MPSRQNAGRGFTLIELLVVVAIISIIAAILFPVFAKVREKGRQTMCESNLHQIGIAWEMYTQDYDDQNVIGNYFSSDFLTYYAWFGTILPDGSMDPTKGFISPYTTKNWVIQECPSANLLPESLPGPGANFGYGVNEAFYPQNQDFDQALAASTVSISKVTNPSDTILIADGAQCNNFGKPLLFNTFLLFLPSNQGTPTVSNYGLPTIHGLHLGRSNVLWFDGHVKASIVTPPAQPDEFGDSPALLANAPFNLGYVVKPGCAMGDTTCEDYYYQLSK